MNRLLPIFLCLITTASVFAQDADFYSLMDDSLTSGSVIWSITQESFLPSSAPVENKIPGLSSDDFARWVAKMSQYRAQGFRLTCLFKDDNLRFTVESQPGDVYPIQLHQELAFNGVSFTFIDHIQRTYFQKSSTTSFRESNFAPGFVSPRSCGYGFKEIRKMVKNIRDKNNNPPAIQVDNAPGRMAFRGQFPSGNLTLAEMVADTVYPQVFKTIKFINPSFGDRTVINNSKLRLHPENVVYPDETVIDRFIGGTLEDTSNSPHLDRTTLTVISAEFFVDIPQEIFSPSCPEGYTDLDK